jgi:hypothetical protein
VDRVPDVFITLIGKYYFIVKDNYPSKSVYFYLDHAVKIYKDICEITLPK